MKGLVYLAKAKAKAMAKFLAKAKAKAKTKFLAKTNNIINQVKIVTRHIMHISSVIYQGQLHRYKGLTPTVMTLCI